MSVNNNTPEDREEFSQWFAWFRSWTLRRDIQNADGPTRRNNQDQRILPSWSEKTRRMESWDCEPNKN